MKNDWNHILVGLKKTNEVAKKKQVDKWNLHAWVKLLTTQKKFDCPIYIRTRSV